jgi:DNA-directed RNA polymerase subunit RPC12/RpoP
MTQCKHRWEEGTNKDRPAYRCARCGEWRLIK